jgi:hypothetical protein
MTNPWTVMIEKGLNITSSTMMTPSLITSLFSETLTTQALFIAESQTRRMFIHPNSKTNQSLMKTMRMKKNKKLKNQFKKKRSHHPLRT